MMDVKSIRMNAVVGGWTELHIVVSGERNVIAETVRDSKEHPYQLQLSRIRKGRSLTANSYYQVLLDKLSATLQTSREEVHEQLLCDYGVTQLDEGEPCTFFLLAHQDPHKVAKYCEAIQWIEKNGRTWTVYRVLKPSHEMNAAEFSKLLDGIVYECKEIGIEVLSPDRIAQLEEDMKQREERKIANDLRRED